MAQEYEDFVEKFKPKRTTDDCYTPTIVYDAVADWVANEYGIEKNTFCRPFYPGGNYEGEDYSNKVVVDNPPFSILSNIIKFYNDRGIKFFIFAPALTIISSSRNKNVAIVLIGGSITYENGAIVATSFITNLEPDNVRLRVSSSLYEAVKNANSTNIKNFKKQRPKYVYPLDVVTASSLRPYSRVGVDFVITKNESSFLVRLDSQKEKGRTIFGGGYLISERLKAEREKVEQEKVEQEKAEREKVEQEKVEHWELSETEKQIIANLSQ